MTFKRFQVVIRDWLYSTFGYAIAQDQVERNLRFLEESLELFQACGLPKSAAIDLVGYVYGRPKGELSQEVGGVIVTLTALCNAYQLDLGECARQEHLRICGRVEEIRKKQAAKPRFTS